MSTARMRRRAERKRVDKFSRWWAIEWGHYGLPSMRRITPKHARAIRKASAAMVRILSDDSPLSLQAHR